MYKYKYLKYKSKYLQLKGGRPIIDNKQLFTLVNTKLGEQSSFDKLLQLIKFIKPPNNILVGSGNFNIDDYDRFKNNNYYTVYIETINNYESITNSKQLDIEKQYYMFTIFYEEIEIERMPLNCIDNIHLDLMVSYFCPRDGYLDIIRRSLKPNGKFIFQYVPDHSNRPLIFHNNIITDLNGDIIDANIFDDVIINHDNNYIFIPDDNIDIFFSKRLSLSPEINYKIRNLLTNITYTSNIIEQYTKYLRKHLPEFIVELKTFTYSNYTYPVPLKIWNSETIEFLINNIMLPIEKQTYIENGIFSDELLDILFQRLKKLESEPIQYERIRKNAIYELQRINYYFEITKN
jgi:hypothetical protein